jgi:hypothetical protein
MARYHTTIDVPAAPAKAFAYLADLANSTAWDPSVVEATRLDDGPLGVGARFRVLVAFYGRRIELAHTIETYEPDCRLVLVAKRKSVSSRDVITIEPAGAGSRITYDAELRLNGALRLLDRGLQLAFGGMGDRAAAGLRAALGG